MAIDTLVNEDRVKGGVEMMKQAAIGLELMKANDVPPLEGDVPAATAFKADIDAKFAAIEADLEALPGKENKKARTEKSKAASALKKTYEYIDAERVVKGLSPVHGFFGKPGQEGQRVVKAAPVATQEKQEEKKDDKKPKKAVESAGTSPAERQELEKLKTDIIARKAALKETGMSGGQINKDPEVVAWVARMNELKEKENPGSTTAGKQDKKDAKKKKALSGEAAKELDALVKDIEDYRLKLKTEFKYTDKEIKVDPDMMDLQDKLKALQK